MREIDPDPLAAHDVAAFVAAVERGSIQGAADALLLSQSAVTKRVQALERRLGVVLLERGRFGVRPTTAGAAFLRPASRALAALADAERAALASVEHERPLGLAASHTIGEFLLPRWLSEFARPPESVHPQVSIVHSPGVVDAVRAGRVELGFVEHDEPLEDLQVLDLCGDEIVAVVAPGHRWAGRATVAAEELPDDPFLTREEGSGTRSVALRRLAAKGIVLRPTFETASTESLKHAVQSGGFTLISNLTATQEASVGTLCVLRVEGVDLTRRLRAIREPEAAEGAGARFWDWVALNVAGGRPRREHAA